MGMLLELPSVRVHRNFQNTALQFPTLSPYFTFNHDEAFHQVKLHTTPTAHYGLQVQFATDTNQLAMVTPEKTRNTSSRFAKRRL